MLSRRTPPHLNRSKFKTFRSCSESGYCPQISQRSFIEVEFTALDLGAKTCSGSKRAIAYEPSAERRSSRRVLRLSRNASATCSTDRDATARRADSIQASWFWTAGRTNITPSATARDNTSGGGGTGGLRQPFGDQNMSIKGRSAAGDGS